MSDLEFDVLDELYFVSHFDKLLESTSFSPEQLKDILIDLYRKGWLKIYTSVAEEAEEKEVNLETKFRTYFYLASKAGLLAHNGR